MASLLPLISELLPMIMPSSVHIVRAKDIEPQHPTVEGPAIERSALVDKCSMSATVLTIRPESHSSIRHNSEQDAIMYLISGSGILLIKQSLQEMPGRFTIDKGDFAVVPAWTEYQVRNEAPSGGEDAQWLVVQGGSKPVGANLTDWGGAETSTRG